MFTTTDRARPAKQRWVDSSSQANQYPQYREEFSDEEYLVNLQIREPAVRYVIQNFIMDPNDPLDYMKYPITIAGVKSHTLGIELSQWGYPIHLIVKSEQEAKVARKNAERQGGKYASIRVSNFYQGIKSCKILIWVDDDKSLPRDRVGEWVSYLKQQSQFLIFAVKKSRDAFKMTTGHHITLQKDFGSYYFGIHYH